MRFLLPLCLLFFVACSGDATKVRLVNATSFNLENAALSFGGNEEAVAFLAAGDDSKYFRFDSADDCNRRFMGTLQSFGEISSNDIICGEPAPLLPGKYSLTIAFEAVPLPDGTLANEVFLRLRQD